VRLIVVFCARVGKARSVYMDQTHSALGLYTNGGGAIVLHARAITSTNHRQPASQLTILGSLCPPSRQTASRDTRGCKMPRHANGGAAKATQLMQVLVARLRCSTLIRQLESYCAACARSAQCIVGWAAAALRST
jgi:hypothetical protein